MKPVGPIFDPAGRYLIEVRGQVDVDWLRSFDSSVEIVADEAGQREGLTVLKVHTDQSGIVGLVRRLHGLGMTILQVQAVADQGQGADAEERGRASADPPTGAAGQA
jgi:hypothetical protein